MPKKNLDSTFFVYGFICILQSLPCCIQYSNLYSSKAKSTNKLIIILRLAEVFPTPPFAEASSKNTTAQTINVRYKILCDIMDETLNQKQFRDVFADDEDLSTTDVNDNSDRHQRGIGLFAMLEEATNSIRMYVVQKELSERQFLL